VTLADVAIQVLLSL